MNYDKDSFLAGIAVGRKLRGAWQSKVVENSSGGGYGDLIHGEFKMAPLDGRVLAYTDIMIRGEYKEAQA